MLLGTLLLAGCGGGPTSADTIEERTAKGILVVGAGSETYSEIDSRLAEVESCWGVTIDGEKLTVTVTQPELYDSAGQGVIRINGTLVYGMRAGNTVWVAPDLAALRHELSHVVGESATGTLIENGNGKCWL